MSETKIFFTLLKKAQIEKKEFFYCKNSSDVYSLVSLLEKYGYIRFFIEKNKKIQIFLKIKKMHFFIRNMVTKKSSNLSLYNKSSLINLKRKHPHCLFILKTRKGVLCDKKALNLNCFGPILAEVSVI